MKGERLKYLGKENFVFNINFVVLDCYPILLHPIYYLILTENPWSTIILRRKLRQLEIEMQYDMMMKAVHAGLRLPECSARLTFWPWACCLTTLFWFPCLRSEHNLCLIGLLWELNERKDVGFQKVLHTEWIPRKNIF